MEAQTAWAARPWVVPAIGFIALVALSSPVAHAAGYRTTNFAVDAPTQQLAKEIGDAAEHWRRELAKEWLGRELPNWSQPCPIKALVSPNLGAGGATSFVFAGGNVFDWRMNIQGSRERVLDSVLPHEVTHTIFASHFRRPLPRWADEGACTTVEHHSEIAKQERMLIDFLKTRRGIPFSVMFSMKEYPEDVLPLYAQGHSLAKFLIDQRGKAAFLAFVADGMRDENWPRAMKKHYQYEHLLALQNSWMDWIRAGRPEIRPTGPAILASAEVPAPRPSAVPESVAAARATSPQPAPASAALAGDHTAAITPTPERQAANDEVRWASVAQAAAPAPRASVYDASRPSDVVRR